METYILADNQDITREGLRSILQKENEKSRIESAKSCVELREILSKYPQSVVILDYTLFDIASINQLLNMRMGAKESSWILFSDELDETFLRQVLLADSAVSVIMKHDSKENIIDAIACASANEVYLCDFAESILKSGVPQTKTADNLTASEKNVLREIALGKTTKEIAWEKNLSFHTVNTHRRNIFRKLGVNNAHEATKYALQAGLLDLMEYYI